MRLEIEEAENGLIIKKDGKTIVVSRSDLINADGSANSIKLFDIYGRNISYRFYATVLNYKP